MKKTMTIKEALKAGYKMYGEDGQEELDMLEDLEECCLKERLKDGKDLFLSEKECTFEGFTDAECVIDDICENIECWDDNSDVYDAITPYKNELDEVLDKMAAAIKKENATNLYKQTDIKLICA